MSSAENVSKIELEIDYEKLAAAIVDAQNKAEDRDYKNSKTRILVMKFLNGSMYLGLCLLSVFIIYRSCATFDLSSQSQIFKSILIIIYFSILAVIAFLAQQESLGETIKETRFHFNTNISLAAIIIALIALYYEIV